jgi:hypothetical protein
MKSMAMGIAICLISDLTRDEGGSPAVAAPSAVQLRRSARAKRSRSLSPATEVDRIPHSPISTSAALLASAGDPRLCRVYLLDQQNRQARHMDLTSSISRSICARVALTSDFD